MKRKYLLGYSFLFLITFYSCSNNSNNTTEPIHSTPTPSASIPVLNYSIIKTYPHDTNSFTEGFLFHNNELYESTGATSDFPQTRSLFGVVDITTGKINKKVEIDREKYFGEGIAFLNGKVYQLTYKTKVGFVYDATSFKKLGQFTFPSEEGWGLTTDGKNIIMSDGTNAINYLDPTTLQAISTIYVSENNYAKDLLNELEYINGYLYANIWTTSTIVKIDPNNGKIVAKLELAAIVEDAKKTYKGSQEMNGIAFDSIANKIYVTGKMWPKIYEIEFPH